MSISNIPLFSMLRTRMHWHQERQRVLAENVANADTPRFQPRDLAPPALDRIRPPAANVGAGQDQSRAYRQRERNAAQFQIQRNGGFEARPSGNAVSLEDEMMKVANNQMDYQAATSLYSRGLGLLRTAIGRRG